MLAASVTMSVRPRGFGPATGASGAGASQAAPEPKRHLDDRRSAAAAALGASSRRRSRSGSPDPARPGLGGAATRESRGRSRLQSGTPRMSIESSSSAIRSATRRLVLARRLSLITPAGRWVARIRCRPSERPRWATSTTPSTNSGTSFARAANSSTTMTRLGGASGSPARSSSSRSFAFLRLQQLLPVVQLGPQRGQRAADQVRGEVGDQAHGVRQVDAVGERGAALVVDEEERHPVRAVRRGHAQHPGLQELALARAGGAADEGVRALRAEVEVERFDGSLEPTRARSVPSRSLRSGTSRRHRTELISASVRRRPPGCRGSPCRSAVG